MASYLYNPSQKVAELLSHYLEFDAHQLQVGIWSGHLTLKDVHLKANAVDQFLTLPSSSISFQLVSGTIGLLDLQIPWKQLVWGQSDVRVKLQDVVLVLQVKPQDDLVYQQDNPDLSDQYPTNSISRDQKQKRLLEAERRALQGRPLGPWLRSVKKRDEEDSAKSQAEEPVMLQQKTWISKRLTSAINDFFWRFFAGLQMEMTNLKIVLVQDGVEVGVSVHSFKVDGKEAVAQPGKSQPHGPADHNDSGQGELVNKQIKVSRCGLFIRKEGPRDESDPRGVVLTKEYILCPLDLDFSFGVFYPYPPGKRQKRDTTRNYAATPFHLPENSLQEESSNSSSPKKRRAKREKRIEPQSISTAALTTDQFSAQQQSLHSDTKPPSYRRSSTTWSKPQTISRQVTVTLPLAQPKEIKSNVTSSATGEHARLEGHLNIGLVQLKFTTRHYHLFGKLMIDTIRRRNGRPNETIRGAMLRREQQEEEDESLVAEDTNSVVRSWWIYVVTAVLREVRKRRQLREKFQDRFLSFIWDRQKYKRSDYVRLYIDYRLKQHLLARDEEELLRIEDELSIEQILLYRHIARKIHVRGGTKMPSSLFDLGAKDKEISAKNLPSTASNISTSSADDHRSVRYTSGPLGRLEEQCERIRLRNDFNDFLFEYRESEVFSALLEEKGVTGEERSFISAQTSVTGGTLEPNTVPSEKSLLLFLSFSAQVDCIEMTLIEEELFAGSECPRSNSNGFSNGSAGSKITSELSVLTEDELWDNASQPSCKEHDPLDDSDYVIFGVPEKMLLHMRLQKAKLFVVSGDTGKIVFSIARIVAFGSHDNELLSMGTESVTGQLQQHALLSLVELPRNGVAPTLQVDAAAIRLWAQFESLNQLTEFFSNGKNAIPPPLLKASAREEVRLYIQKESSHSAWSRVHTSIRIYGTEVMLGHCTWRLDMIELYSGNSIPKDCTDDIRQAGHMMGELDSSVPSTRSHTRTLRMIEDGDLAASSSPWSQRWVFALSGADFTISREGGKLLRMLEFPIDSEALVTFNANGCFDGNRAKVKVLLKISSVCFLVSDERHKLVLSSLPRPMPSKPARNRPPRLEVLSRFVRVAAEVSVQRCQIIFCGEKSGTAIVSPDVARRRYLERFLETISCFDLSFPHEEVLSSAMQICVECLTGTGMPVETAWHAVNAALNHFLEQTTRLSHEDLDISSNGAFRTESAVRHATDSTLSDFNMLNFVLEERCRIPEEFVLDFADGFKITTIQLFYDSYVQIVVPSFFCSNGEGVHLVRLSPSATSLNDDDDDNRSLPSYSSGSAGLLFTNFLVDKENPFGRGGSPLSVLKSDKDETHGSGSGTQETLSCCRLGEVELLYTKKMVQELYHFITGLRSCDDDLVMDDGSPKKRDSHFCMAVMSASLLLATDDLIPFSRLILSRLHLTSSESFNLRSEGLHISNLSPDSEVHPVIVSTLVGNAISERKRNLPFSLRKSGSHTHVTISCTQIVFLQKFFEEFRQLLLSPIYGALPIFQGEGGCVDSVAPSGSSSLSFRLDLEESSLLLPRSSISADMIAIEIEIITICLSNVDSSFSMPDGLSELHLDPVGENEDGCGLTRTKIEIRGARIFSTLSEVSSDSTGQPVFHHFYEKRGRASPDKKVFVRGTNKNIIAQEEADECNSRLWREMSVIPIAVDVIVDRGPHLRLLLTNPGREAGLISLAMRNSQFNLLLSIWYSNMQELPYMFPYAPLDVKAFAELPVKARHFPELGTEEWKNLLMNSVRLRSEFCLVYDELSFRMSFDCYDDEGRLVGESPGSTLCIKDAVLQFTMDEAGVARCGIASKFLTLNDENCSHPDFLVVAGDKQPKPWADMLFGLREDYRSLSTKLAQPFQASVFLTPSWSMINVGVDSSRLVLSDFGPVHRLLEFATAFGTNEKHGNPLFEAATVVEELKKSLRGLTEIPVYLPGPSDGCKGTDFRLWMTSPMISIPCIPLGTLIAQGDGGLWFHYTTTGDFSSQEIVSGGLSVKFQEGINSERKLIEDLTFGVLVDHKIESNHTDYSIQMPLTDPMACSVVYPRLAVAPTIITDPFVCQPADQPSRHLGPRVCELTCVLEVLPSVASTILGLFSAIEEATTEDPPETNGATFTLVARISDIRFFLLDPILGIHLPIFVLSLSSMRATISQFDAHDRSPCTKSALNELQVIVDGHLWADYFKLGSTRSWEPLLEAYKFCLFWEKSSLRGGGLTLSSDSPLHANISSAFLVIVSQVFELYKQQLQSAVGVARPPITDTTASMRKETVEACRMLGDVVEGLPVTHRKINDSDVPERVAFSLKNMTGQRIRFYRYESLRDDSGPSPILTYLDHSSVVKLSFEASVSSVQNLVTKEVKYPGFNEISEEVVPHVVDIQLPGCSWIRGLRVDSFGRSFAAIEPKEVALKRRIRDDWKLHNLVKVLIEIGFEKGGRQVVIRSLFEVVNKTSHSIRIICHPNPNASPHFEEIAGENIVNGSQLVQPGDAFNVPTLILLDALNRDSKCTGSTGSLWIKPDNIPSDVGCSRVEAESGDESANKFEVHFSSRAIHLSRLVEESASIFEKSRGNEVSPDDAKTAVHLACPLVQGGDRMAPFCYAVEVGRSPIVGTAATADKDRKGFVHGPVLYSLSIHPPFVVVNLLPKKGRFELMHAVHKKVLWFKDVEPGEEVAVHSLGLDSPLMLHINLGFCRTPVGEGALVHHGEDHNARLRENLVGLKSIGKAGKAVTKQIGKTLTAIGDSPDKRAQNKIFKAQNPHLIKRKSSKQKQVRIGNTNDRQGAADGKTYRVDSSSYSPQDVVEVATVVDSLGQKLTLQIENIRGGGGQRRISVYCPFWIVNTTEHPLRYKQENSKVFVCGTVHSPDRDGSKLMSNIGCGRSGGDTQGAVMNENKEKRSVFAGTPGALASISGKSRLRRSEIAGLLDAELSLTKLWDLAFMFNFPEGLGMAAQRLCIQLGDGTGSVSYQSDWSKGLTLESVGITQVANMHCKDGRFLGVTVIVHVAPGILSSYTRIVRILPRYVFVNMLGYPVRLWQDNSIFHPLSSLSGAAQGETKWRLKQRSSEKNNIYENLWGKVAALDNDLEGKMPLVTTASQSATYIDSLDTSDLAPFVLPDTRGDRVIRFDFGGSYKLTASVSVDEEGESVLPIKRYVDLKTIRHITTRASPEYQVNLAPDVQGFSGELGVWFESEWGNSRKLIVKGVKKPSFAFYETDIHVGDELLKIDGIPVTRHTFAETMEILRFRLNELRSQDIGRAVRRRASLRLGGTMAARESQNMRSTCRPLELVFRTMEESVRRVRMKASQASAITNASTTSLPLLIDSTKNEGAQSVPDAPITYARVELKNIHHMMFVVLRPEDSPPFSIRNQTFTTTIYFRQKSCTSHSWYSLKPGESCSYAWQEPLKPRRLSVRVAPALSYRFDEKDHEKGKSSEQNNTVNNKAIKNEEDAFFSQTISVQLEEIGSHDILHWQDKRLRSPRMLEFEVDVIGITRVLVARDFFQEGDPQLLRKDCMVLLEEAIEEESKRSLSLVALNENFISRSTCDEGTNDQGSTINAIAEEANKLMSNVSELSTVTRRHQVLVEILESSGLCSDSFVGDCNPYVEIRLKHSRSLRRSLMKKTDLKRTYYVRKSLSPTWDGQTFVFDVPQEAVDSPREHTLNIVVRNYRRFGRHNVLGKAQIELHCLRNQEPLVGWFPLAGRTGRRELENQLSQSIRLRAQWIYSIPGLLQYYTLLSEKRLIELQTRKQGLLEQFKQSSDAEEKKATIRDDFRNPLSVPKPSYIGANGLIAQRSREVMKTLMKPLRSSVDTDLAPEELKNSVKERHIKPSLSTYLNKPSSSDFKSIRIGTSTMPLLTHNAEHKINDQRQEFKLQHSRTRKDRDTLFRGSLEGRKVELSSIRSWTVAQHLFNDDGLAFTFDDSNLSVLLNPSCLPAKSEAVEKLGSRNSLPSQIMCSLEKRATGFRKSRESFEKAAKRSYSTILNEGGFLTIRPIQASNLSSTLYSGMLVKVRCGEQVTVTNTVDARVAPVWTDSFHDFSSDQSSARSTADKSAKNDVNDVRIRVDPQENNGWVRLSVMGERRHQQLQGKAEIGVAYLPLGKLVAACVEASANGSPVYERWFPLLSPEEAAPVEGRGGLIPKPPEVEQPDETKFRDIYRPRIQLAIFWTEDKNGGKRLTPKQRIMCTGASPVSFYVKADIPRLSAALIDSERSLELLSFNIMDIDARYWITDAKSRLCLSASWTQIDNQAANAREAIVLAPTPNDFFLPVARVFAVKDNLRSVEVVSFELIDVSIAEFDVTIEEQLVCDLFILFYSLKLRNALKSTSTFETIAENVGDTFGNQTCEPRLLWLLSNGFSMSQESQRVYVQVFSLSAIKFNLSYVKGRRNTWELTRRPAELLYKQLEDAVHRFSHHAASDMLLKWSHKTSSEDKFEQDKGLQNLPKLLASLFPNVSDAPIRLQEKTSYHLFESPSQMLSNIRKFYYDETMKQIYKIIGSLDFVGNPTMLVSSVFAGFKDLLLAPSSAFLQSPTDPSSVGVGVAKGTLSFFSHSTSGFFAFCTKVSATASQFAANLSLDRKFSDWHRESVIVEATNIQRQWKKRGVNEVGSTLFRPIEDILGGFGGAIFHFFFAPVDGLRKHGVPGLISGLAVGVTGLVARPVVGILDAIVHISASVHDIARSVNILEKRFQPALRVRLAYTFGFMNILMHYESSFSHADALIKRYPLRQRRSSVPISCEFVVHVEVLPDSDGDATYAIITNARIILLKLKKGQSDRSTPLLCWELLLDEKPNISSEVVDHGHSGVAFTIKVKKQKLNQAHYGGLRPPRKVFSSPDVMRFQSKIRRRGRPLFSMDDENIAKNELEAESQMDPDRQEDENVDDESDDEHEVENEELRTDTANDFDHYTKMDTEGEVVECFSILAEYQFRRQLGRLHNALCCILGNFDSIMRDPDFGFHGHQSQEGYTVFGIYRFSPDSLSSNTGEHQLPKVLENLPWVSDSLFETCSDLPFLQQQQAVARERQSMNDSTCLRASAEEGGATWLIHARAWALSLEKQDDEDVDLQSLSDSTESKKSGEFGSNVDIFSSARATFDQVNDQDSNTWRASAPYTSIHNEGDTNEQVKVSGPIMLPTNFLSSRRIKRFSSVSDGSCTSFQSFGASFATANEEIPAITSSGSIESHAIYRGQKRDADDACDSVSAERVTADFDGTSPSTQRRQFGTTSTSVDPPDRMGRMESLMEQLISFSAEQSMMRERQMNQSGSQEFTSLRQQLRELTDELRKKAALDSSLEEVAKLREEVAWLKQRLVQKDELEGRTNQNSSSLQEKRRKRFSFRSFSSAKGRDKDRSDQEDIA